MGLDRRIAGEAEQEGYDWREGLAADDACSSSLKAIARCPTTNTKSLQAAASSIACCDKSENNQP